MNIPIDDDSNAWKPHMVEYHYYDDPGCWQWNIINDCDVVICTSYLLYMSAGRYPSHNIRTCDD